MDEGAIRHVKWAKKMRAGLGNEQVDGDLDSSGSRGVTGNKYQLEWVLEGTRRKQKRQPTQTIHSRTFALKQHFSKCVAQTGGISTI